MKADDIQRAARARGALYKKTLHSTSVISVTAGCVAAGLLGTRYVRWLSAPLLRYLGDSCARTPSCGSRVRVLGHT